MRIVAGRFRGKTLLTPKGGAIRPTSDRVREAVFNILGSRIGPDLGGRRVLDLFAGTGALGIEALSRGAAAVVFVDNGIEARGLLRAQIDTFGIAGRGRVFKRDATALGPRERFDPFDLIFLDPPYNKGLGEQALASALAGDWLAPGALIVWEEDRQATPAPPDGLDLVDQRCWGDTQVLFLERPAAA